MSGTQKMHLFKPLIYIHPRGMIENQQCLLQDKFQSQPVMGKKSILQGFITDKKTTTL